MNNAKRYAHMLYAVAKEEPARAPEALRALVAALQARHFEKLLPRVYAEYQKLVLAESRRARHTATTPERERTRALLELYRRLVSSH